MIIRSKKSYTVDIDYYAIDIRYEHEEPIDDYVSAEIIEGEEVMVQFLPCVDNPELFNDIVITENETYNIIGNPTFHDITINNINPGDIYFDANNQVMAKFDNHFDSYTLRPTDFIIKIK